MSVDYLSDGLRLGGALLAAGCLAWIAVWTATHISLGQGALRHLQNFHGLQARVVQASQLGDQLAGRLPFRLDKWALHLMWAQRAGFYPKQTLGTFLLASLQYAGLGLLLFALLPVPILLAVPLLAAAFPWIRLQARAQRARRRALRALPDVAVLVAAELAAGSSAENAILRAKELPGPLSDLLAEAGNLSSSTSRPLFGHPPVTGALVDVFSRTGLPALRAFALQLDEVAKKGVDSALLMNDTARALALEYRERVMIEKELLDGRLTRHVAFHFFMPAVLLILAAFFIPMIELMSQ
jgi:Flp pilus assembly protein TadB